MYNKFKTETLISDIWQHHQKNAKQGDHSAGIARLPDISLPPTIHRSPTNIASLKHIFLTVLPVCYNVTAKNVPRQLNQQKTPSKGQCKTHDSLLNNEAAPNLNKATEGFL